MLATAIDEKQSDSEELAGARQPGLQARARADGRIRESSKGREDIGSCRVVLRIQPEQPISGSTQTTRTDL